MAGTQGGGVTPVTNVNVGKRPWVGKYGCFSTTVDGNFAESFCTQHERQTHAPHCTLYHFAMLPAVVVGLGLGLAAAAGPTCHYALDPENGDGRHGEYRAGSCQFHRPGSFVLYCPHSTDAIVLCSIASRCLWRPRALHASLLRHERAGRRARAAMCGEEQINTGVQRECHYCPAVPD